VRKAVAAGCLSSSARVALRGGSSRCTAGGGAATLPKAGAVFAGDLAGPKARVLLQLAGGAAAPVAGEAV
jgi:L-asparaginase/Glu-tRNA(Gln) amidotransferase subunit D